MIIGATVSPVLSQHSKVIIVVTLRVSFVFTQECASKFCGSQLPTCGMLLPSIVCSGFVSSQKNNGQERRRKRATLH